MAGIEARVRKMERRLEEVKKGLTTAEVQRDLEDVKNDVLLWGGLHVQNVAAQALLSAYGAQFEIQGGAFALLAVIGDGRLRSYAAVLQHHENVLGEKLDRIVAHHRSAAKSIEAVDDDIQGIRGLLMRHPQLCTDFPDEVSVVDNWESLKVSFLV